MQISGHSLKRQLLDLKGIVNGEDQDSRMTSRLQEADEDELNDRWPTARESDTFEQFPIASRRQGAPLIEKNK